MNFDSKTIEQQKIAANWFENLRNKICTEFEAIENEYANSDKKPISLEAEPKEAKFTYKKWGRPGGGGGTMSMMKGNVFEKVGVNISTVFGQLPEDFTKKINWEVPSNNAKPYFWASGISLVAHMRSPLVPAAHFNTRFICTDKKWFGGGGDLNPVFPQDEDTKLFHDYLAKACDKHDLEYYPKFKKWCDEYFFIKHRNQPRGVGGIFYDRLDSNNWQNDFDFTRDVGLAFLDSFPQIIRRNMFTKWNDEQREAQFIKRGLYTEFNLVYDRGTKFGLETGGNSEAILMSLPPIAKWP